MGVLYDLSYNRCLDIRVCVAIPMILVNIYIYTAPPSPVLRPNDIEPSQRPA